MVRLLTREARRLVAVLGPDLSVAGQSLVALGLNSSTSLVAGAVLGAITGTFAELPGLLILVPPAIGLRGNVFSAVGGRLSTAIHSGQFHPTLRRGTVLGDNVVASLLLTSGLSLALAVLAKGIAGILGERTIPLIDLATISIAGGMLASTVVLVATVALAFGATRFGWDLDNLVAPIVSMLGDVLTIPALWAASHLVRHGSVSTVLGWSIAAATAVGVVYGWRTRAVLLRVIVRQSWPVLVAALVLSTLAGVVIEKRLETLSAFPALLILVPAFVSSAGALGGILSSRLSSGLHLGLVSPKMVPSLTARLDARLLAALAVPIYAFNAVGAHLLALWLGKRSPGAGSMLAASMLGASGAVVFVLAVAYYGSVASFRLRVDPDTYGIPAITSSVDFVGAVALVAAIVALGIA
ncbi:MAG TPA: magnesium transporter [Acidimicrobiales bacterium]|nr:magnesium transporter [Acidimicrobiales bacterium]